MQDSNIPAKFSIPFANAAGGSYIRVIPTASQIGITDGAASLTDGFVPMNFIHTDAGGIPPDGRDVNGILSQTTAWIRWLSAGGPVYYESAFSTAIGGYPKGAAIASATVAGVLWTSTVENNTSNPDTGGAGWITITGVANTWTQVQRFNSNVVIANNTGLFSLDTGGTLRNMVTLQSDNYAAYAAGPSGLRLVSVTGASTAIMDNSANLRLFGSLTLDHDFSGAGFIAGAYLRSSGNAQIDGTLNATVLTSATSATVNGTATVGALSSSGNITSTGGYLLATRGARSTGGPYVGVLISDFFRSYSSASNGYEIRPDGSIDQIFVVNVPAGGGILTTTVLLPLAFPALTNDAIISMNGTAPPGAANPGSISVQLPADRTDTTHVLVTTNYATSVTIQVVIRARGI